MIKKLLLLLFLTLLAPAAAIAQLGVGSWKQFPTFRDVEQLIETPDMVYCLSAGTLTGFDIEKEETKIYDTSNLLTETGISSIHYNPSGKYLAVVYPSCGIDILFDNGKMVSLPDIKEAVLNSAPVINDVAFSTGKMFVATNFGIVVFDDKKMEVAQSAMWDKDVTQVAATDEYIAMYIKSDNIIWMVKNGDRINDPAKFHHISLAHFGNIIYSIAGLSGNKFLVETSRSSKRTPFISTFRTDTNEAYPDTQLPITSKGLKPCKKGQYFYGNDNTLIVDTEGNTTLTGIPTQLQGKEIAFWDSPSKVWAGDSEGFAQYSFADGQAPTVIFDKIKGEALSCTRVGNLYVSPTGKLYVYHYGWSIKNPGDWPNSGSTPSYVNVIENGKIRDVTPMKNGKTLLNSTYQIVEDPTDPDCYFATSYNGGIYRIKDNAVKTIYDQTNSTFKANWGNTYMAQCITTDKEGNLIASKWKSKTVAGDNLFNAISFDNLKKDKTTSQDWISYDKGLNPDIYGDSDECMLLCRKSNTLIFSWRNAYGIVFRDTKGTFSPADDSNCYKHATFTDQDGKTLTMGNQVYALMEDSRGRVWVGHTKGVFIIPNPADFSNPDFRIQSIKVPRNDGTNFADYLLDGENVLSIAEDGIGRKWIGTANSGVYLVNENGTEILENFNVDNSILTTNSIYAVACDPNSNAVYFGSTDGLVEYISDAAPASSDYSDVYAYPNPVRPEYTGWITVKGLMDSSLVKIADASGNVFFEGKSNGGLLSWDGCDASGNRVKTGVYYVFASQGGTDGASSSAAVTKILVVN